MCYYYSPADFTTDAAEAHYLRSSFSYSLAENVGDVWVWTQTEMKDGLSAKLTLFNWFVLTPDWSRQMAALTEPGSAEGFFFFSSCICLMQDVIDCLQL